MGLLELTTNKTRNVNNGKIGFLWPSSCDPQRRATQPAEVSPPPESIVKDHIFCLEAMLLVVLKKNIPLRTCKKTDFIVFLLSSALPSNPSGVQAARARLRSGDSSLAGRISNLTVVPFSEDVL